MEIIALILFVLSTSGTPGPNNIMLLSSGLNFGIKKTVPHMLGINLGFPLMIVGVGIGLLSLFQALPSLFMAMKLLGGSYLIYLAFKIATTPVTAEAQPQSHLQAKPLSFIQAAAFQWVNPKAWIMAVSAIVTFSSVESSTIDNLTVIALIYCLFGLPCSFTWMAAGAGLKNILQKPLFIAWFNRVMASLLVVSLIPMFRAELI
ncbi:LysE family translocator [Thalassotalea euphylliae]|uniref:LysE family translocator n=1 Tax=Thalassotalea euphylliae TaxID=1655234 RepID=A0A3E0UJ24_9GAMM|nr:LysE family translocator [Thalassotalea euphylliae]REL36574.1 LysE family translocator [Thalassotalea euphylliae]